MPVGFTNLRSLCIPESIRHEHQKRPGIYIWLSRNELCPKNFYHKFVFSETECSHWRLCQRSIPGIVLAQQLQVKRTDHRYYHCHNRHCHRHHHHFIFIVIVVVIVLFVVLHLIISDIIVIIIVVVIVFVIVVISDIY